MKHGRKKSRRTVSSQAKYVCKPLTKKEAADLLKKGVRHIHSTELKQRDPLVKLTETALGNKRACVYPWESGEKATFDVVQSLDRTQLIVKVIEDLGLSEKRHLRERLATIFEELLTNAIYHAYTVGNGAQKYERTQSVQLESKEILRVEYLRKDEGIFISVEDFGGTLEIERVAKSIARCYQKRDDQIEEKSSGAGLGMYLVFELCTHLKILVEKNRRTKISVWVADKGHFDPDTFSFNYFDNDSEGDV